MITRRSKPTAELRPMESADSLRLFPRISHEPPGPTTATHLFHLGIGHTLTAYDAAYIALAELTGGTLVY